MGGHSIAFVLDFCGLGDFQGLYFGILIGTAKFYL